MSEDKAETPEPQAPHDKDRAAILARRQHFIALALTGLASTVACDASTKPSDTTRGNSGPRAAPQPCLDMPVTREEQGEEAGQSGEAGAGPTPPPPQVCLKMNEPELRDEDTGTETGEPLLDPKPPPRPCLKRLPPQTETKPVPKPTPRPCLRQAKP